MAAGSAGLLKTGLRATVSRLHARHLHLNAAAREWRPGIVRRILGLVDRHSRLSLGLALAIYLGVALAAALAPAPGWTPDPPNVTDYFRDLQAINLGLFGAQAALLGLVYPLVIGLVGLLFEARSSRGNRLQVYFRETEALSVGGMSLSLLIFMGLQLLGLAIAPLNLAVAVTVLNVLWFTANLAALGFFVVRSLDFMRPARRHALMKAFLANTAWSAQLRDGMMLNQWSNASLYGHLPAGEDDHAIVMPFDFEPVVQLRHLRGRKLLTDVRLGALAAIVAARGKDCRLSFSPWPGITYEDEVPLVRGPAADLSKVERWLVGLAFRFSSPSRREPPPLTEEILGDAAADLLGLMEAGRFEEFRSLLRETLELHRLLYALGESPVEPGAPTFNYAALKLETSRSYAWEWAGAYRDLLVRAGDHLSRDERFFESCAYIAGRVMRDARKVAPFDATRVLFHLPATLFRALVDGAARRRAEAAEGPVARGSLFTPTGLGAAEYRAVWLRFVAGWESLGEAVAPRRGASWDDLRTAWPAVALHLHDTALRVAQAAKSGEQHAIGWSVDVLLKWQGKMLAGWNAGHGYALMRPLVSAGLLEQRWPEVEALGLMRFDEPASVPDVFATVVDNAWVDTQVVLACSLIGLLGEAGADGRVADGPGEAASALFRNQSFDPSAANHPRDTALAPTPVLQSVLRLIGAGERFDEGYCQQIGELADEIDRLEGPNYVSARIYSWSGEADVQGQAGLQVLLLAATVSTPGRRRGAGVDIGDDLKALLLPADDRKRRRMLQHLEAMRTAAADLKPERAAEVVATLRRDACTRAQAVARLAEVVRILEACEAEIRAAREAAIAHAAIDPARLAAVRDFASRKAFSKDEGAFPITQFKTVTSVEQALKPYRYRMETKKGRYTAPLLDDPIGNEEEWWESVFRDFMGAAAFREVIGAAKPIRRAPQSAESYWQTLKAAVAAVAAAGQAPLIVRSPHHDPDWLGSWRFDFRGARRPADMRIEEVADRGDGYDFDLNGTAVFSSPWTGPATWVLGREVLDGFEFQRFAEGGSATVVFEPDAADIWKGHVVVNAGLRVTLGAGPIWRIAHPKPRRPDGI